MKIDSDGVTKLASVDGVATKTELCEIFVYHTPIAEKGIAIILSPSFWRSRE